MGILVISPSLFAVDTNYCNSKSKIIRVLIGENITEGELNKFCTKELTVIDFWDKIISKEEFINNNYRILRFEFLQGLDDKSLFEALVDFEQIRLFQTPTIDDFGEREYQKLFKIYNIPKDYMVGDISLEGVQTRLIDNYVYDQINMGVNNFINSTFAYLLGRTPTHDEFNRSLKICDNKSENLFFQEGNSRMSYLYILTHNDNYYEYQVKFWFEKILFIEPSQSEINNILLEVRKEFNEVNLKNILLLILSKYA